VAKEHAINAGSSSRIKGEEMSKVYLGDSVYVECELYGMKLTTENGLPTDPSNTIYLDVEVLAELQRLIQESYWGGKR